MAKLTRPTAVRVPLVLTSVLVATKDGKLAMEAILTDTPGLVIVLGVNPKCPACYAHVTHELSSIGVASFDSLLNAIAFAAAAAQVRDWLQTITKGCFSREQSRTITQLKKDHHAAA